MEWNIKLSQYDSGDILEKIRATFEGYWNNPEFTPFIAALDSERLRKALRSERRSSQDEANDLAFHFDLKPYYYQQEILDKLKAEREVHHSFKNLVVAATGTGKTVIAAFDYRDFCRANPNRTHKLLFVAHRKEILSQSMSCFRGILKDLNFGSMMVGGVKPDSFDDLFVSIQSFNSKDLTEVTSPDFYDYIVIDEFHQNMFAASTDDVLISDDEAVSQFDNYTAEDFLSEVFMTEERYNTLKNLLIKKKNIILQGAPGVGKTYAAERLAYSTMGEKDTSRVMVIQFHQSYSYEDFIMGYRPTESGFSLTKGPFYDFCKEAEPDDREYFFIIDEINRGNLSRIFGELLMLIENDKRGKEVRLLYSDEQFSVPENVYIIGMMNTADRSLAMIDYALRRRFAFFEFEPAFGSAGFKRYQATVANKNLDSLVGIVDAMNRVISSDASLGSGFCVGHSYFCTGDVIDDAWLSDLVEYELIPLIKEYWFDEPSKVEHWSQKLRGAIT
nr:DEAD/DEAH box helicase family protein [Desulfosporosinus sp. I2]